MNCVETNSDFVSFKSAGVLYRVNLSKIKYIIEDDDDYVSLVFGGQCRINLRPSRDMETIKMIYDIFGITDSNFNK